LARKSPIRKLLVGLVGASILAASCGGEGSMGGSQGGSEDRQSSATSETTMAKTEESAGETTAGRMASSEAAELARAEIGPKEITNMLPADRKKPDDPQPLPADPPRGIEVYPATTNRTVEGPIEYDREPPTNGNHAPLWQNCGIYEKPVEDKHAVHSMDHGVVWITHHPNLPQQQIEALRPYGNENYVIVSPYPGQDAPVTATSWRVQLELDGTNDPRLGQFVDDFRVSELAPLSGNRCTLGVGDPQG
jgi:Protein of unknown function (DUF3105)